MKARIIRGAAALGIELFEEALDNQPIVPLIVTVENTRKTQNVRTHQLELHPPTIVLPLDEHPLDNAQVSWRIIVEILVLKYTGAPAIETGTLTNLSRGVATGSQVDPGVSTSAPQTGPAGTTEGERVLVSWGVATTTAKALVVSVANKCQATAQLDFTNTKITPRPTNDYFHPLSAGPVVIAPGGPPALPTLFGALLDHDSQFADGIDAAFQLLIDRSPFAATPDMALGAGSTLQGLAPFRVHAVATRGNQGPFQVLSLCIDIGEADGDLGLVRPFVEGLNYAYFASGPVLEPILLSRWPLVSPKEETYRNVDVPFKNQDGDEIVCQATVRVRLLTLTGAQVISVPGSSADAIHLIGQYEVELQELYFDGRDISDTDEARPLITTKQFGYQLYLFPFDLQTSVDTPSRLITGFGATLLQPLFYPVVAGAANFDIRIYGVVAEAAPGVFMRGNVSSPLSR